MTQEWKKTFTFSSWTSLRILKCSKGDNSANPLERQKEVSLERQREDLPIIILLHCWCLTLTVSIISFIPPYFPPPFIKLFTECQVRHCHCPYISHCSVACLTKCPRSWTKYHNFFPQSLVPFEVATWSGFSVATQLCAPALHWKQLAAQPSSTHLSVDYGDKNTIGWVPYTQQTFLTVLEAGSPRSRHRQTRCLVKNCFLVPRTTFLLRLHMGEGVGVPLGCLTHPIHEGSTLMISPLSS